MTTEDELRARCAVLYDALSRCRATAQKYALPDADREEGLARVREVATTAKNLVDSLNDAAFLKGMELADEEIIGLAEAAGGFHYLTPEGQVRYCGARKRQKTFRLQRLQRDMEIVK